MAADRPFQIVFNPFPFYGNGNVGDDFMLDGFLKALKALELRFDGIFGRAVHYPNSQFSRFPELSWNCSFDLHKGFAWAAIGSTPFQLTWGDWILQSILARVANMDLAARRVLVCSGVESEIFPRFDDFRLAASLFDLISARDRHSLEMFKSLGVSRKRLFLGADLSHLSFLELSKEEYPVEHQIGLILATETMAAADLDHAAAFMRAHHKDSVMVAGDFRDIEHHEVRVVKELSEKGKIQSDYRVVIPPYEDGAIRDLFRPFASCATLLSSRYHGLLAAAWAGRRIGAIGRSSKIIALAEDLEIPIIRLPFEDDSLYRLREQAVTVPRKKLESFCEKAIDGVNFCLS